MQAGKVDVMSVSPNRTSGEAEDKSEPAREEEEAEGRIASNMETTSQVRNLSLKLLTAPRIDRNVSQVMKLSGLMF